MILARSTFLIVIEIQNSGLENQKSDLIYIILHYR